MGKLTTAILVGLIIVATSSAGQAAETLMGRIQEGECGISLTQLSVDLTTNLAKSQMIVRVRDHDYNPVVGARVYVHWSTREDGTENYCTTTESGECTVKNDAPIADKAYPIYVRIIRVEHPEKTYVEYEDSKDFWIICPEFLDCS